MTNTDFAPTKGMSDGDIADTVTAILANATLADKVAMMSGRGFFKAYVEDGRVWAAHAAGEIGNWEVFLPEIYKFYKAVTDTGRNPFADLSVDGVGRTARYRFLT